MRSVGGSWALPGIGSPVSAEANSFSSSRLVSGMRLRGDEIADPQTELLHIREEKP
ncbi:MAG: hypothetical protein QNJ89_06700 [Acidimicrobiia bacterium]|nr:hypothetical protein [Acidimicrobiia bacterium]